MNIPNTAREIIAYHERTKHHYDRMARSTGYMDWANQPEPFRSYQGTRQVPLPFLEKDPPLPYANLYEAPSAAVPLDLNAVAAMLELSLGLSAWKAISDQKWALRMNPSSGNLHPTEAHLVIPPLEGIPAGIYHYAPLNHTLECRATFAAEAWKPVAEHFQSTGFLVALTTIFWRESWKYGERAFRYCNHDVGHAVAALSMAANMLGWQTVCLTGLSDDQMERVLGLDRTIWFDQEAEHADLMCWVTPHPTGKIPRQLDDHLMTFFAQLEIRGTPNRLSRVPAKWPAIDTAAANSRKPVTPPDFPPQIDFARNHPLNAPFDAAHIIRKRRSAVAYDRRGRFTADQFFALLDQTLPRNTHAPFNTGLMAPHIHLFLFVHSVTDLTPGIYMFVRDPADLADLQQSTRPEFQWQPVLPDIPLYLLQTGNYRRIAARVSCYQEIAGESDLSLGMIARFEPLLLKAPYRYRQLFWESGMIGQVLYLEAEARGKRGTGIGCYFDDGAHEILGIRECTFQSLYHFTIGDPIEDGRLTTLPAYHHLPDRRKIRADGKNAWEIQGS